MKKIVISVTEAARNFADCVNRAHDQNVTFVLIRNGAPVARLVPHKERICKGSDLAEVLDRVQLSTNQAKSWNRDLRAARKHLKSPAGR